MIDLNPVIRRVWQPTINDYIKQEKYIPLWKRVAVILAIQIIIIVIGPILSLIDLNIKLYRNVKKKDLSKFEEENYNYLYLFDIEGAGEVSCRRCSYTTKLIGNVDYGKDNNLYLKGYQCQTCGRVHEVEFADGMKQFLSCPCGGAISRSEILFCPECRSNHLEYETQFKN